MPEFATAFGVAIWNLQMGGVYLVGAFLIGALFFWLLSWTWLRKRAMPKYRTLLRLSNLAILIVDIIQAKIKSARNTNETMTTLEKVPNSWWEFLGQVAIAIAIWTGAYFCMIVFFILTLAQVFS